MNLDVMTQVRAGSPLAGVGPLVRDLSVVLLLWTVLGMPFLLGTWIAA